MYKIDLTGRRFGKLTVTKFSGKINRSQVWECKCDCGNIVNVRYSNLFSGATRSCGCLQKELVSVRTTKDISGKRFGYLIATSRSDHDKRKWVCRCDCGNIKEIAMTHLVQGKTKSCGCERARMISDRLKENISGVTFSRLTAIYPFRDRRGSIKWECSCSCGERTSASVASLRSGHTQSCGCLAIENLKKVTVTHGLSNTTEYRRFKNRKRHEMSVIQDSSWTPEMEVTLLKFFPECILCGSQNNLSVDHVFPLSSGFGLRPGNAIVLCRSCNSMKGDRYISNLPKTMYDTAGAMILFSAKLFEVYWNGQFVRNDPKLLEKQIETLLLKAG